MVSKLEDINCNILFSNLKQMNNNADLMCKKDEWITPLEITSSVKYIFNINQYPIIDICSSKEINKFHKFDYYMDIEANSLDMNNLPELDRFNIFCNPPSLSTSEISKNYPHKELFRKLSRKYSINSLAAIYFKILEEEFYCNDKLENIIYIGVSSKLLGIIPEVFNYEVCICNNNQGRSESISRGGRIKFSEIKDNQIIQNNAPTQNNFIVCMSRDMCIKEMFKHEFSKFGVIV